MLGKLCTEHWLKYKDVAHIAKRRSMLLIDVPANAFSGARWQLEPCKK
jgi:hypothetical protein